MPYDRTDWTVGDTITEALIDKMEQGIADAHEAIDKRLFGRVNTRDGSQTLLPPGWTVTFRQTGWVRINHDIGDQNYMVLATGQDSDQAVAVNAFMLLADYFEVQTRTLVDGTTRGARFSFEVIRL